MRKENWRKFPFLSYLRGYFIFKVCLGIIIIFLFRFLRKLLFFIILSFIFNMLKTSARFCSFAGQCKWHDSCKRWDEFFLSLLAQVFNTKRSMPRVPQNTSVASQADGHADPQKPHDQVAAVDHVL